MEVLAVRVALYGPPSAGKTSVGRRLAARLGLAFVDTDALIAARTGLSVPALFERDGEAGFRRIEAEVCRQVAGADRQVVALGGGALLDAGTRLALERSAAVVCLQATCDDLLGRLDGTGSRPLLGGPDPRRDLVRLLEARRSHYESFAARIETSGRSIEESAAATAALVARRTLHVRTSACRQEIVLEYGALEGLDAALGDRGFREPHVLVTDENVASALASRLPAAPARIVIPPGEAQKTLASVERLCGQFAHAGLDRRGTLIVVGGGVVGDLAGFCAATFMRGVRWVNVPTTLLAMVDASVGGKTAVNLPGGKNLVGSFHAPTHVVSDPLTLATLPCDEWRSGLAEVIKHAVIADAALFASLEAAAAFGGLPQLAAAIEVKTRIVESDPFEEGERAVLNFGHTIGHALETASDYRLRHGEAVAIGMVGEARLAERIGLAHAGLADRIASVVGRHHLPTTYGGAANELRALMNVDKKKAGTKLRFALPEAIGRVVHGVDVDDGVLAEALATLSE
jgi:3-dehydroquinate synthase